MKGKFEDFHMQKKNREKIMGVQAGRSRELGK